LKDPRLVEAAVEASGFPVTEVVSGGAQGIDLLGEEWAHARGIPVRRFPADWESLGRGAGHARNAEMAAYGDALVLVWDGMSPGSRSMLAQATARNLAVYVHRVSDAAD
jgi:hypothetical protein